MEDPEEKHPVKPCPNSWSTDPLNCCMSQFKLLRFGVIYYAATDNWYSYHSIFWFVTNHSFFKKKYWGVPIVAQWKWIWLVPMRMLDWSLALLSGSGIQCCCELWCRLQMQLGSCIDVAVAYPSSCSSNLTPRLETSIFLGCGPRKQKAKQNKTKKNKD